MKLRNKKTGGIGYLISARGGDYYVVDKHGWNSCGNKYNTLAELNEEWEDYEEPKDIFWIDNEGTICGPGIDYSGNLFQKNKEIGNYFDTKEEAEKAVEKLKAWHKLMDYWETEVLGWEIRDMPTGGNWQTVNVNFNVKTRKEPMELINILFGGEE